MNEGIGGPCGDGDAFVASVLDDWRNSAASPKLKAALAFLEVMVLRPSELGPVDAARALDEGVSPDALEDAALVAAAFQVINGVADALGFDVPSPEDFAWSARSLLSRGYV
jgi:alkylhydroperoxidase family enzyme